MHVLFVSSVVFLLRENAGGGISTEVCNRGSQTSRRLIAYGTTFTTSVAVYVEGISVVTALSDTAVNGRGKLHGIGTRDGGGVVATKLHDTVDGDKLLSIGGFPRPRGG